MFSLRPASFGAPADASEASAISAARLVIVGEHHSLPPCVELQRRLAVAMLDSTSSQLHVVLEHFNFEQQVLLDGFADGTFGWPEMIDQYAQGTEGHGLEPYRPLLQLARDHRDKLKLHAGFIPRSFARIVMRESAEAALTAAKSAGHVGPHETLRATEEHYGFFESLLTQRSLHNQPPLPPSDKFRKMFPAQVIKDASMAHKVATLFESAAADDRVLVICGVGHSGYSHGVPERVYSALPWLKHRSYRVWCLPVEPSLDLAAAEAVQTALTDAFGPGGVSDPADLCLAFSEVLPAPPAPAPAAPAPAAPAGGAGESMSAAAAKAATAAAYNAVGSTAYLGGDALRARAIMTRLGYDAAQVDIAGTDMPNFQARAARVARVYIARAARVARV